MRFFYKHIWVNFFLGFPNIQARIIKRSFISAFIRSCDDFFTDVKLQVFQFALWNKCSLKLQINTNLKKDKSGKKTCHFSSWLLFQTQLLSNWKSVSWDRLADKLILPRQFLLYGGFPFTWQKHLKHFKSKEQQDGEAT